MIQFLLVLFLSSTAFSKETKLCLNIFKQHNAHKKTQDGSVSQNTDVLSYSKKETNLFDSLRLLGLNGSAEYNNIIKQIVLHLSNDKIIDNQFLGGGVTPSYIITLSSELKAVYKPINPNRPNQIHREVAAFNVSHLLGLHIVPPTIIRTIDGVEGSLQLFLDQSHKLDRGIDPNHGESLFFSGQRYRVSKNLNGMRLQLFDWLINNHDRGINSGNYLLSPIDGYLYGIDHSVAFVGHDKKAAHKKTPKYKEKHLNDLDFYQRLKSVNENDLRLALDGLHSIRIDEFIERYRTLIKAFANVENNLSQHSAQF